MRYPSLNRITPGPDEPSGQDRGEDAEDHRLHRPAALATLRQFGAALIAGRHVPAGWRLCRIDGHGSSGPPLQRTPEPGADGIAVGNRPQIAEQLAAGRGICDQRLVVVTNSNAANVRAIDDPHTLEGSRASHQLQSGGQQAKSILAGEAP